MPKSYQLTHFNEANKLSLGLFIHVLKGDIVNAAALLNKFPATMILKENINDTHGRIFQTISPLELAAWSLDIGMCELFLSHIPSNEQGQAIRSLFEQQIHTLDEQGISYKRNGILYTESHYSFSSLIDPLRHLNEGFNHWTLALREEAWKKVCIAQNEAPAHIYQHYCDPDCPFIPTPSFETLSFDRHGVAREWHNSERPSDYSPSQRQGPLGIIRGRKDGGRLVSIDELWQEGNWRADLPAIEALSERRTNDWNTFKQKVLGSAPEFSLHIPQC